MCFDFQKAYFMRQLICVYKLSWKKDFHTIDEVEMKRNF